MAGSMQGGPALGSQASPSATGMTHREVPPSRGAAQRPPAALAASSRAARLTAETRLLPAHAAARLTRIVNAALADVPFAEL